MTWDPSHQGTATPGRTPPPSASGGGRGGGGSRGLAVGGVLFAGVLMFVSGVLAVFQGVAAIAQDDVYAQVGSYVYELNLTGWGWVLLIVGAVAAATGWRLLTVPEAAERTEKGEGVGKGEWARVSGIALASLSLILQFLFLPYAPVWAVVQIAIDIFVIWALATYRPSRTPSPPSPPAPSVTPRARV
ncbi:hypothetical protein SAMN04487983_10445 [Streptomyces sp. yr375]|nr:hypothetical protein SAMN04487983_10445 [Streptomyces sp. yr375]